MLPSVGRTVGAASGVGSRCRGSSRLQNQEILEVCYRLQSPCPQQRNQPLPHCQIFAAPATTTGSAHYQPPPTSSAYACAILPPDVAVNRNDSSATTSLRYVRDRLFKLCFALS